MHSFRTIAFPDIGYRDLFMKNIRASIELGHYFEMYIPLKLTPDSEPKWTVMLGKKGEKARSIHGICLQTELMRHGLKPAGGRELQELSDIAQYIIQSVRDKGHLTKEQQDAVNDAENYLRSFREKTTSTSDLSD